MLRLGRLAFEDQFARGLVREGEAARFHRFLAQVRDEARSARQDRHAAQPDERKVRSQQHGGDGRRHVQPQVLADDFGDDLLDRLRDLDETQAGARFLRHGEQPRHARVALLVQRVAIAGDGLSGRAPAAHHLERGGAKVAVLHRFVHFGEQPAGRLRSAQDHAAATEDACGDRALQRVRRRGVGHARGLHARHHAVIGDRDQRGVQHHGVGARRPHAGHQEAEVVGEGDVPDQVLAQVLAAHRDAVLVGRADGGARHRGPADLVDGARGSPCGRAGGAHAAPWGISRKS